MRVQRRALLAFTAILEQDLFYSSYPLCEQLLLRQCPTTRKMKWWLMGQSANAIPHSLSLIHPERRPAVRSRSPAVKAHERSDEYPFSLPLLLVIPTAMSSFPHTASSVLLLMYGCVGHRRIRRGRREFVCGLGKKFWCFLVMGVCYMYCNHSKLRLPNRFVSSWIATSPASNSATVWVWSAPEYYCGKIQDLEQYKISSF